MEGSPSAIDVAVVAIAAVVAVAANIAIVLFAEAARPQHLPELVLQSRSPPSSSRTGRRAWWGQSWACRQHYGSRWWPCFR